MLARDVAAFLFFSAFLYAQENASGENITAAVEYIEDAQGTLTYELVSQPQENRWKKIGAPATHFGFSRSIFWLRLNLTSQGSLSRFPKNSYLVFEWKALDAVELFLPGGQRYVAGDTIPKAQWSFPESHFPAFKLEAEKNPQGIYYVRLESTSLKNFPIALKTENTYLHDLKHELTIIVIYSTITMVLIAFAFFLFVVARDINFLIYIGYLVSIALAFDTTFGNAFDLLWPNAIWWQNRAGFTLVGVQIIFSFFFVSRLLDFRRHLPRANLVCNILAILCALSLPISLMDLPVVWFSALYSFVYLLSIPAFFAVGIYLLPKAGMHVRLFILGWGIFFFFAIFHILYLRGVLAYSGWIVYSPIFIFPVDILFFFMAAWEKQRLGDRERMRLLDEKMQALLIRSPGESKVKYQKSSLTDVDIQSTLERLKILVEQEQVYLIEDLRLPDLAKALGLNRTQLSELLNSHFQKNFANFINEYRVQEAQRLLRANPDQNVLDIAFATGFGSKAAFSTEFKRVTGMTAKEFREQKNHTAV